MSEIVSIQKLVSETLKLELELRDDRSWTLFIGDYYFHYPENQTLSSVFESIKRTLKEVTAETYRQAEEFYEKSIADNRQQLN